MFAYYITLTIFFLITIDKVYFKKKTFNKNKILISYKKY